MPDDAAIYMAIAEAAKVIRDRERDELAFAIAEGTRKVLGG